MQFYKLGSSFPKYQKDKQVRYRTVFFLFWIIIECSRFGALDPKRLRMDSCASGSEEQKSERWTLLIFFDFGFTIEYSMFGSSDPNDYGWIHAHLDPKHKNSSIELQHFFSFGFTNGCSRIGSSDPKRLRMAPMRIWNRNTQTEHLPKIIFFKLWIYKRVPVF